MLDQAALTIAFWLHMAATIVWIGGLFYQAVVVNPALERLPAERGRLAEDMRRRFQPLAWLSLLVLFGTGLLQMSGNPNYVGLFAVTNPWSRAILTKHITVGLMMLVAAYQTWVLNPRLSRLALKREAAASDQVAVEISRLNRVSLAFGILVLGLTALARTA
ncbi:MAG: CopD family protein [Chloroflexi bacterium]|nr:CopD family protein [Chloroflexota bacterium]